MDDEVIVRAMETYGGGFIKALAACWRRADEENRRRIREAFPDYWEKYRELGVFWG